MAQQTVTLQDDLDRLAAFEPSLFPVISLYLNASPDQRGRDHFEQFVRKELPPRARTFPLRSAERESFDSDVERIERYLTTEIAPATNGLALFASAGTNGFFEAVQLAAPIPSHSLHVGHQPHLYPLARIEDQYRRYGALVADTNSARIYVFGIGKRLIEQIVNSPKTKRTHAGGWSQARFQRHVDSFRQHHAREVAGVLERLVRDERLEQVVLGGDEVILPMLREELSEEVSALVIDELKLDIRTPEHEVFRATLEAMHARDGASDRDKVARLLDEYRAGALGVVGARDTLLALEAGEVNELLVTAEPAQLLNDLEPGEEALLAPGTPLEEAELRVDAPEARPETIRLADALVFQARRAAARITFIEDPELLAGVGGVGALLRYRIA